MSKPAWQHIDEMDVAILATEQRLAKASTLLQTSQRQLLRHEITLARNQLDQQAVLMRWYRSWLRLWRYPTIVQLQQRWDLWRLGFRLGKLATLQDRDLLQQLQQAEKNNQAIRQEMVQIRQQQTLNRLQIQNELEGLVEQRQQRKNWLAEQQAHPQAIVHGAHIAFEQLHRQVGRAWQQQPTQSLVKSSRTKAVGFRPNLAWPTLGLVRPMPAAAGEPALGCLIQASLGSPVIAIAKGRVLYAAWLPGLGQVVLLEHAGAWQSVYGHLRHIHVQVGQEVESHSVLGQVGDTGSLHGIQLYFALWQQGKPLTFPQLQQLVSQAPTID